MSFTSLLFCPDENTARAVTQVLTELDFTVETVHDSGAAVQQLAAEHFHALVVDCANEQDAALLFNAARNSAQNSGSLAVAVVEGQAGVAKAFRIGANLVLTRPINIEQSKSTLRVARGLLKKAQPKSPATAASEPAAPIAAPPLDSAPTLKIDSTAPSKAAAAAAASTMFASKPVAQTAPPASASVPFSGLVLESDPEPITEAADAAVLDSLPQIHIKRPVEAAVPALLGRAEPVLPISSGGAAAAAAPALEKKVIEFRPAGAAPMVTNEAIVATSAPVVERAEAFGEDSASVPSFSSLEQSSGRSGGSWFLKLAAILAIVGAGGYFAWQQPQVRQFAQKVLHRNSSRATAAPDADAPDPMLSQEPTSPSPAQASPVNGSGISEAPNAAQPAAMPNSSFTDGQDSVSSAPAHAAALPTKPGSMETIEVQELPIARDSGKITVTPKLEPILVKNAPPAKKSSPPAAPSLDAVSDVANATAPDLTPINVQLPKAAPGTVRISQGVSQGLLVKKVQPAYPDIAKQFHREGSVQVLATIDKNGEVKRVQLLNGDPIFAKAAVDAVKRWEYRPYLLNGQPVEIETQITVIFKNR